MNIIIGGGIAGLIAGFYLDNFYVFDKNYGGQLNSSIPLGPRYIQKSVETIKLLKDLNLQYDVKVANIGFEQKNIIYDNKPDKFAEKYTELTRNKKIVEKSFLSENNNKIEYLSIQNNNSCNSMNVLINTLITILKSRGQLIKNNIKYIENYSNKKLITFSSGINLVDTFKYIISTIPVYLLNNIFINNYLVYKELKKYDFTLLEKNFLFCNLCNKNDIELAKKYDYIYSIDKTYSRKTYYNNYIIYEIINEQYFDHIKFFDKNKIIESKKINLQLKNSYDLDMIEKNIFLLGRYAQWSHKIKINEVIRRVNEFTKRFH